MPEGWLRRPRARWRALPVTVRDGVLAAVFLVLTQAELVARADLIEGPPVLQHLLVAGICGSVALRRTRPALRPRHSPPARLTTAPRNPVTAPTSRTKSVGSLSGPSASKSR